MEMYTGECISHFQGEPRLEFADKKWKYADKEWKYADKNWKYADTKCKYADKKWKYAAEGQNMPTKAEKCRKNSFFCTNFADGRQRRGGPRPPLMHAPECM